MAPGLLLLLVALGLMLAMAGAFMLATARNNHGFVDAIWSLATGAAGIVCALVPLDGVADSLGRRLLVAVLLTLWSLRLGGHILRRALEGHDDPRYVELRRQWGDTAGLKMFGFLQIQAACAFVLALAAFAAAHVPVPHLTLADGIGLIIGIAALWGEAVADAQLARFRAEPANRGRVCDTGLWGLSRHPNYFFEWLGWIAYPVIAIGAAPAHLAGYAALLAPLLLYVLLVHGSGIPPTEAQMLRSRGEAFRRYQRQVNAFFPGPRRS